MPYSAEISKTNPTCFVVLLDQSGSMGETLAGSTRRKADEAAIVVNKLLQDLIIRCAKHDELMRYFAVSIIGYGAKVQPVLGGTLAGQSIVWIDDVYNNPLRIDSIVKRISDGVGGIMDAPMNIPVWVDPVSENGTPMTQAFQLALSVVQRWVEDHPRSFPPIVMNISAGESTDGNPTAIAEQIKSVPTADGSPLLMNTHLSSDPSSGITAYPDTNIGLRDQYAKLMFGMSSELPDAMRARASMYGYKPAKTSRAFLMHAQAADIADIVQFLNIGS